jgi:lipoyl(octanoyl) transferase
MVVMKRMSEVAVLDWGSTRYVEASERQRDLVAQRLAGEIADTLVFTEHEPVYTLGLRAGAAHHLVWNEDQLRAAGISVARTNRGGDITYYGPGQIVGYPIVDLSARRDLHAYLRWLEQVLIDSVARFGVEAARREGLTGIWVGTRKIAAIGVAVRRWVAYHGFALNVAPDLSHFQGIVPCGIGPSTGSVTSLSAELGRALTIDEAKPVVAAEFRQQWLRFIEPPASSNTAPVEDHSSAASPVRHYST